MHFLSNKSAGQCLTKKNCNTMRTGGRYGQGNLFFLLQVRLAWSNRNRERGKLMGGARARALSQSTIVLCI